VAVSQDGLFLSGWFSETLDFDPTDGVDERTSTPESGDHYSLDLFLTKLLADGSYAWTYTIGGAGDDFPAGVEIDATGDIFLAGSFEGTVDFDPGPGVDAHAALDDPCDCLRNAFLVKLSPNGTYQWTKSFRPLDGSVHANELARDASGNLIITGYLGGLVDFDPGVDIHLGGSDIFVTKLDGDGGYLWTRTFGGSGFDSGRDVCVDAKGNIYVTGIFRGRADFDPGPGTDFHQALLLPIREDVFVTKLHPDGSYGWTVTYPVYGNDQVAVSPQGDVVLTGAMIQTVDFDPTSGQDIRTPTPAVEGQAPFDLFVTKLHSDGSYAWTYSAGAPGYEEGEAAWIMPDGGVLVVGLFRDTVDFDPGLGVAELTCPRPMFYSTCEFLLRLNGDGSFGWVRMTQETGPFAGRTIVGDGLGHIYFTRRLVETDVDPTCGLDTRKPTNPPGSESYLTKLTCLAPGDADDDGDVDLVDVAAYQNCFTGGPNEFGIQSPCAAGCDVFDVTPDNALNLADWPAFQTLLTGPR
jgi:hypothetical protein